MKTNQKRRDAVAKRLGAELKVAYKALDQQRKTIRDAKRSATIWRKRCIKRSLQLEVANQAAQRTVYLENTIQEQKATIEYLEGVKDEFFRWEHLRQELDDVARINNAEWEAVRQANAIEFGRIREQIDQLEDGSSD